MLTIRLQRTGKNNQADFRIVLAEKAAPVQKKHLEVLGNYNPRKKDFKVNEERVKYWVSQRVELSPTVHNLLVTKGLLDQAKVRAFNVPKKPSTATASEDKPGELVAEVKPAEAVAESASQEAVTPEAPAETPKAE